ncbi:hypothetical protein [Selenomonas sp. oral taxon 136]|uniref:hypothetical protein n=1 Tax=Selenomonas sp. oral taxon 136 TaxID=713030 RepID=UPI000767F3E5|nr:hypothetical protein [Selenomonas sp. oral taxon 136]AME03511.1 hypothetical protein AXE86_05095 [Selenomonas sp. oral taxon 136]
MNAVLAALAAIAILGAMLAAGVYFVKKAWFLLPLLIGVGLVYHGLKEMGAENEPILYILGGLLLTGIYLGVCIMFLMGDRVEQLEVKTDEWQKEYKDRFTDFRREARENIAEITREKERLERDLEFAKSLSSSMSDASADKDDLDALRREVRALRSELSRLKKSNDTNQELHEHAEELKWLHHEIDALRGQGDAAYGLAPTKPAARGLIPVDEPLAGRNLVPVDETPKGSALISGEIDG